MSTSFKGFKVEGTPNMPNKWANGKRFVGGELLTENEKVRRIGSHTPYWLIEVTVPVEHIIVAFGIRFDSRDNSHGH